MTCYASFFRPKIDKFTQTILIVILLLVVESVQAINCSNKKITVALVKKVAGLLKQGDVVISY